MKGGVGQGTSPVQSGRKIHYKTGPEVQWPLAGCRFRLSGDVGELKQQQNEQTADTSDH